MFPASTTAIAQEIMVDRVAIDNAGTVNSENQIVGSFCEQSADTDPPDELPPAAKRLANISTPKGQTRGKWITDH